MKISMKDVMCGLFRGEGIDRHLLDVHGKITVIYETRLRPWGDTRIRIRIFYRP